MPHITLEYSANIEPHVNMQNLCHDLREASIKTGIFPMGGIRVRAFKADYVSIGDGKELFGFLDCSLKIGEGRDLKTKEKMAHDIFEALKLLTKPCFDAMPFGLSLNVSEMQKELSFKENSIHSFLAHATPQK